MDALRPLNVDKTAEATENAENGAAFFDLVAQDFGAAPRACLGELAPVRKHGEKEDFLTKEIIGKAIAIHRVLGPGLLESVYEYFLAYELRKSGLTVQRQKPVRVEYDGEIVDLGFRADLIVNGEVIVEVKTVQKLAPIHHAQVLSYLRLARIERGLLINFHVYTLTDGIKRISSSKLP